MYLLYSNNFIFKKIVISRFDLVMIILKDSVLILKSLMDESVRIHAAGPLYCMPERRSGVAGIPKGETFTITRERTERNGRDGTENADTAA